MQRSNLIAYSLLLGCAVALIISITKCGDNARDYSQSKSYIASLSDTITYLKHGIAQKPAVEVSKDQFEYLVKDNAFLKQMLKEAKLKAGNVKQSTKIVSITQIDTIPIPFHDTIPCPEFNDVTFSVDSLHYSIGGRVSSTSISIDKINFPDSLYVITASKKHFFRKDEYLVSVKHSNPYIKTVGLTNLTVSDERKWYESGWVKFGAGILAGGYFTYRLTR